jgi:hypothetical protein
LAFQDDIGLVKPMNAMRAVWSFWSKPWRACSGQPWLSERHHLLAWLLSFETARTFYPLTTLVTDDEGARLLVDGLRLEFESVSTGLNRLSNHDPALWMLGKLYAYQAQVEPFVHLDTDVFLWKRLPAHIETASVFAQCPESFVIGQSYYYKPDEVRHALTKKTPGWIPAEWEWSLSFGSPQPAACCGVLGGRHVDFIRYYAEEAIRLVEDPRNHAGWASLGWAAHNMLIEQYHLAACVGYHRNRPGSPFRDVEIRHLFDSWGEALNPNIAAKTGFTHLLAAAKRDIRLMDRLERRVKHDFPERYARHFAVAATAS